MRNPTDRPRTLLVTGANTGIGAACAVQLARPGVHVGLACRSEAKAAPVLAEVRRAGAEASVLALDLASLQDASRAASRFLERHERLDVLVNNAGLPGQRGLTTADGFELAFGVNHLGHFAFTMPLVPLLERCGGRVVNVSSGSHLAVREILWARLREPSRTTTGLAEYRVSKLCNILFTAELRRRHPGLTTTSVNPGRIASDIWRRIPAFVRPVLFWAVSMKPVAVGGETLVHAAEVPLEGPDAPLYFDKLRPREASALARREALAAELWSYSADAVARALAAPAQGVAHGAAA